MTQLDFGYPWWLSYGHLTVAIPAIALLMVGFFRKWHVLPMLLIGAVALWACAAFVVMHTAMSLNGRASLPTQSFLRSGTGRVLDLGAGTGRSSIMVLEARPQTTLVASDLFAESFDQHFGHSYTPQARLLQNLRIAGVDQRATIATADMRKLPFEAASFDAIVSSYAVDHLNRKGIDQALGEAARVVKPGGEFLLMVIENEVWLKLTFGPLLIHGGTRGKAWWTEHVKEAGFDVEEAGTVPATLYILARRRL